MNTTYASIYLYLLQFPSSVCYNFLSIGLLHLWLNLFLDMLFYFFDTTVNEVVFLVFPSESLLLLYKSAIDFWIFILYLATLLN